MSRPLYRQIAEDIRRKIESGELREGMRVPTEDQLMATYVASRNTVRGALKELTIRGFVYTLHGKGTFVSERVIPIVTTLTVDPKTGAGGDEGLVYTGEVAASGRSPSADEPRVEIRKADTAVAHLLRISEGTEIIVRHQNRYVDGLPWSLQTSYYPRSLSHRAPRLLDAGSVEEGTVAYMAECGIRQAGYQDAIQWRAPDQDEIAYFDLPVDGRVQVTEIRRLAFDENQNRVRLTITVYRADRNRFVLNVGNAPISEMFGNHDLPSASAAGLVIMGVMILGGEAVVGRPIIRIILMSVFIPISWFIPVFSACLTRDSYG
jgi:GntR family transcriptional regulator